jgi:beta-ureidopropionase / N-carbamoyl-L-amino-acid hydrolase
MMSESISSTMPGSVSQSETARLTALLDGQRLERDFAAFAEIGRSPAGGYDRIAYSPADRAARDWLIREMRAVGLDVREDAIGNVIGRRAGTDPDCKAIAMGSHTDSVPSGGNYDGVLGVLGGLAALRTLQAHGVGLRHPVELIDFAAEEATMPGGTVGSRAMAGLLPPELLDAKAFDGQTLAEHMRAFGLDPAQWRRAQRTAEDFAAYLELHIEQGGVLEAEGIPIGVVAGIVGIRRYAVTFHGIANHAGTTPMAARKDALVFAAPFIGEVHRVAIAHGIVGTIGTLQIFPAAPSVIPGQVRLDVEIRAISEGLLDGAEAELRAIAERSGATFAAVSDKHPVRSAPDIMRDMTIVCAELGIAQKTMPSGAGHDAMCIATLAPQGMIFVPSRAGISHAPEEFTEATQCIAGARVLLGTLLAVDATFE